MSAPERIWVTGGHYWENPTFKRDKFEYIRADLAITETQPDPRDEVIGALVDALHAIELWDAARGYPTSTRHRDTMRAALAAAKAVRG